MLSFICLLSTFVLAYRYDRKWQPGQESKARFWNCHCDQPARRSGDALLVLIRLFRSANRLRSGGLVSRTGGSAGLWSQRRRAHLACGIGFIFTMTFTMVFIQLLNTKLDRHPPTTHLQQIMGMRGRIASGK